MKWLKRALLVVVVLVLGLGLFAWLENEPLPTGTPGPDADALAHRIQEAVGLEAWKATRVVRWTHAGRHELLWDKARGLARVTVGDWTALLRTQDFSGRAYRNGVEVTEPAAQAAILAEGRKWFVNDAYWLFPFEGLFDQGVTRSTVMLPDGKMGLLIQYASGGVTPGDAYLWIPDADGRPEAWKMWVQILPIGGLRVSWEGWQSLPGGAQISTEHHLLLTIRVRDLKAGDSVAEVEPGPDPFLPLSE